MNDWLAQEALWRLLPFIGIFVMMGLWEIRAPRRTLRVNKRYRWINNLAIVLINTLLLRLFFPGAAVGIALAAETHQWGLFHATPFSEWAPWIKIVCAVIALDFLIWLQHVLFHALPVLWRLHRLHHADLDFDVTTGLRFHPLEILLSMGIKSGLIVLLGAPAVAVLLFEILLNATAMFSHGNVRLPARLDRCLRWVFVTPDMHRIHHSWHPAETNSNYGFNLSCWDRLMGTYRSQPQDGHQAMTIGLSQFRDSRHLRLDRLLQQPFR
ncbi:MAG: sterol desaturase family protein [Gammaproteobacteria bacterium]